MRVKPDGLAWFTKPEIAIKQRVKDHYRNEKEKEHRKLLEQVDFVRGKHEQQVDTIVEQILSCLDVLKSTEAQSDHSDQDEHVTPKPTELSEGGGITQEPETQKRIYYRVP